MLEFVWRLEDTFRSGFSHSAVRVGSDCAFQANTWPVNFSGLCFSVCYRSAEITDVCYYQLLKKCVLDIRLKSVGFLQQAPLPSEPFCWPHVHVPLSIH